MKLGNILKAENPLTGKTTSLTDVGGIFSMILGVVLLLFVVATGQNVAKMVSSKVGANRFDVSPEPIFASPAAQAAGKTIL